MADVLVMTAVELGHPLLLRVLVESDDHAVHVCATRFKGHGCDGLLCSQVAITR
jgi:hypothetical protein